MTKHGEAAADRGAPPFLRLTGIRKAYPGVVALKSFDMDVRAGEVIGLVGENGAGKSTLMKILGGVVAPDAGAIVIDGESHPGLSVARSMRAGISFVHQELNLFDNLDVAANVFIGREPRWGGPLRLVDEGAMRRAVAPILQRLGAGFSPDAPVSALSLAERQLVEIAKALSMGARLVILDEPTSSLPVAETEKLLEVIGNLKAEGIAVIFISHRLTEVERACDRVIVLRDGAHVGTLHGGDIAHERMVNLMIGRDLKGDYVPPRHPPGEAVYSAEAIRTQTNPAEAVSLALRRHEILGLAGLVGSGRTELARVLFGIDPALGGTLRLGGAPLRLEAAADAVGRGIFLVPEDRKAAGVLLDLPVAENITLPDLASYARGPLVDRDREAAQAERSRSRLGIKTPTVATPAASLSGGNQQKVVLAKWLAMKPKVMIFDEPTRGIDVGAKSEIYRFMRALSDEGVAILMISSDMEEVIGVSDRIAVMHQGRIAGFLGRSEATEENILTLAIGRPLDRPH